MTTELPKTDFSIELYGCLVSVRIPEQLVAAYRQYKAGIPPKEIMVTDHQGTLSAADRLNHYQFEIMYIPKEPDPSNVNILGDAGATDSIKLVKELCRKKFEGAMANLLKEEGINLYASGNKSREDYFYTELCFDRSVDVSNISDLFTDFNRLTTALKELKRECNPGAPLEQADVDVALGSVFRWLARNEISVNHPSGAPASAELIAEIRAALEPLMAAKGRLGSGR